MAGHLIYRLFVAATVLLLPACIAESHCNWIWKTGCYARLTASTSEFTLEGANPLAMANECFTKCGDVSSIAMQATKCSCSINTDCNGPLCMDCEPDCWCTYRKATSDDITKVNHPVNESGCVYATGKSFGMTDCHKSSAKSLCYSPIRGSCDLSRYRVPWKNSSCDHGNSLIDNMSNYSHCSRQNTQYNGWYWIGMFVQCVQDNRSSTVSTQSHDVLIPVTDIQYAVSTIVIESMLKTTVTKTSVNSISPSLTSKESATPNIGSTSISSTNIPESSTGASYVALSPTKLPQSLLNPSYTAFQMSQSSSEEIVPTLTTSSSRKPASTLENHSTGTNTSVSQIRVTSLTPSMNAQSLLDAASKSPTISRSSSGKLVSKSILSQSQTLSPTMGIVSQSQTLSPTMGTVSQSQTLSPTMGIVSQPQTLSPTMGIVSKSQTLSPTKGIVSQSQTLSPTMGIVSQSQTLSPTMGIVSQSQTISPTLGIVSQTQTLSPIMGIVSQSHTLSSTMGILSQSQTRSPAMVTPLITTQSSTFQVASTSISPSMQTQIRMGPSYISSTTTSRKSSTCTDSVAQATTSPSQIVHTNIESQSSSTVISTSPINPTSAKSTAGIELPYSTVSPSPNTLRGVTVMTGAETQSSTNSELDESDMKAIVMGTGITTVALLVIGVGLLIGVCRYLVKLKARMNRQESRFEQRSDGRRSNNVYDSFPFQGEPMRQFACSRRDDALRGNRPRLSSTMFAVDYPDDWPYSTRK